MGASKALHPHQHLTKCNAMQLVSQQRGLGCSSQGPLVGGSSLLPTEQGPGQRSPLGSEGPKAHLGMLSLWRGHGPPVRTASGARVKHI